MEFTYCETCGDMIPIEGSGATSLTERFVCDKCQAGGSASPSAAKAPRESASKPAPMENLQLFSDQTIALRRERLEKPPAAPATAPAAAGSGSAGSAKREMPAKSQPAAAGKGSAAPANRARKIVYRCLHCQSPLSVRPVAKTSRLACPGCGKDLYITASGQIFKQRPSTVVRKKRAQGPPKGTEKTGAAENVGLKTSNPLSSVVIHPTTAFEAHKKKIDPNKTFFLTSEETLDLSDLDPEAPEAARQASPEPPAAEQLLLDDEDFDDEPAPRAAAPRRSSPSKPRQRRPQLPPRRGGTTAKVMRCVVAAALAGLPFHAVALFPGKSAEAKGSETAPSPRTFVERLGETAEHGVTRLLGD